MIMNESEPSEMQKLREILLQRSWSDDFMIYEYDVIIAGVDYLQYLLKNDKFGNLLGNGFEFGNLLLKFNNELLKIVKNEILEYKELKGKASDQSIKNYYMLLEKKHNYLHPIYEESVSTIYNQSFKTEEERLNPEKLSAAPLSKPEETIADFADEILNIKDTQIRSNLLKNAIYIYKVFPKSEARLKSVCACISFLCEEFLKLLDDKEWESSILTPEQKGLLNKQRYKYLILAFRLLQRDEKCLHKRTNCLKTKFHLHLFANNRQRDRLTGHYCFIAGLP